MAKATELDRYLPKSPRVLDIGGGTGVLAESLRDEYNADVMIVEPNADEAKQARAKGFDVLTDVFETANLDPASFDLVVMMRTVDHLIDASATFTKISQTLRAGGVFLVDGADYFRRMAHLHDAVKPLKIDHCYYFSVETLTMMMRKNGLSTLITDLVVLPGEIVNLAQAGEPEEMTVEGLEMLPGGEVRFHEWEDLANRPGIGIRPGAFTRSILAELRWLGRKVVKKSE